jgi:uncharacterized protein DUF3455
MNVPNVPDNLKVPAGEEPLMMVSATGYQIYICQLGPEGTPIWTLKMPLAELKDEKGVVIGSHYGGPTWKLIDGSEVTGKMVAKADAPEPGAIPWLLVAVATNTGHGKLAGATSIHRVNTTDGLAPSTCTQEDVGKEAKSSYTADYYFYAQK